jgi:tetratricopeptide (TPR) repeat protein
MKTRWSWIVRCLLAVLAVSALAMAAPSAALAAGGGDSAPSGPTAKPEDPEYAAAVRAIKAEKFGQAIPLLQQVVTREASNADAYNWLAYATRKNGDPAGAIPLYQKALAIDPKHRGAHEYIGEAYLALNDLPKAKEHLKRLDSLCFLPCGEYRDLKKAVEAYEKTGGKAAPAASR